MLLVLKRSFHFLNDFLQIDTFRGSCHAHWVSGVPKTLTIAVGVKVYLSHKSGIHFCIIPGSDNCQIVMAPQSFFARLEIGILMRHFYD